MIKHFKRTAAVTALAASTFLAGSTGAASATNTGRQDAASPPRAATAAASYPVAWFYYLSPSNSNGSGCPVVDFGYSGLGRCGSYELRCDWNQDGNVDEAFVISPSRYIYHAWPGHGWQLMPNNGRADDMHNCYWNGNHQHQVEVDVFGVGTYYSYLVSGVWYGWYRY
ncbi:MAG: hypothetical protein HOV83_15985 [Catenulispora sp.]|nr:hypothetical protein [Catenulispora sp.]